MQEIDIKTRIALLLMTYNGKGKLTKFQDGVYGFVDETNKVRLLDLINNKIFDEAYNIRYIGDNVIILNKIEKLLYNIVSASIILDRKTFKIIEEKDSEMTVYNKLIVSKEEKENTECILYDLHGNKLWQAEDNISSGLEVQCTDRDDYYIISFYEKSISLEDYKEAIENGNYNEQLEQRKTVLLIKYNEDSSEKPIEVIWKSNKYDVENIGYGLYKVSDARDFSKVYVYDLINLSKIELDV